MRIYFAVECKVRLVDHWVIDAPPRWSRMSEKERKRRLEKNLDRAEFRTQEEVHSVEDRTVLDFHTPHVKES